MTQNTNAQIRDVYTPHSIFDFYWNSKRISPGLTNLIIKDTKGSETTYRILDDKICLELGFGPDFKPKDAHIIKELLNKTESNQIRYTGLRIGNLNYITEAYFVNEIQKSFQLYTGSQYPTIANKIKLLKSEKY